MNGREFAVATREELWSLAERPTLLERRLVHGVAVERGTELLASDGRDEDCARATEEAIERARPQFLEAGVVPGFVRILASSRKEGALVTDVTCVMSMRGMSVVSDAEHVAADAALLQRCATREPLDEADWRAVPIVWRNGSAAVLFHEAIGHAAEHGHAAIELPAGLRVDIPLMMRRASFTDVPLLRMQRVRVSHEDNDVPVPSRRIDVHLVSGGHYEALTEVVTLRVASAELVDGVVSHAVRPFRITDHRRAIVGSIRGAFGEPERYPGVICSREGQDLFVPSVAPAIVTELR